MRRTIALMIAGGLIALAPAGAAWAQTPAEKVEELLVSGADTPAEHQVLAAYYREKAEEARSHAKHHRKMAERYSSYKHSSMPKHCDKLVSLNEQEAAEYEELAKGHEAEAGAGD